MPDSACITLGLALAEHAGSLLEIVSSMEAFSQLSLLAQAGAEAAGDTAQAAGDIGQAAGDVSPTAGEGTADGAGQTDAAAPGFLDMLRGPLPLFAGIFFLFYLFVLMPERRKQAETTRLRSGLKKNDRVVTTGGIIGVVVNASADSDEITIRIDETNNTKIRVLRSAIGAVTPASSGKEKDKDDSSGS